MTTNETNREPVPAALRELVRHDFGPVVPLAPPWQRATALALPTLFVLVAAALILAKEGGASRFFSLAGGGVSITEWLCGFGLAWLALREAVPGLGLGAARSLLALGSGIGVQTALGIVIWQRAGSGLTGTGAVEVGAQCATIIGSIGLPHLAIATWLALRALPIRPRWSGALAGAASGLLADGVWHLACARNDLEHLLVWHFGATIAMTLLGALSGSFWSWRRGSGA